MAQGSFGRIHCFNDFSEPGDLAIVAGETQLGGGVGLIGVNEGSMAATVDEPGGIIAITTDTADNDNHALVAGTFVPADGGMQMEARFKLPADVAATTTSVWCGFSETMSRTTPVMPSELATATLTINGTGGMAGMYFDTDATTIDWRGIAADAGAVLAGCTSPGDRANATITADRWWIVRVEISPAGFATIKFGDADSAKELKVVTKNTAALDTTANYTAVLLIENRDAAARIIEVDYFYANGFRNWSPS